MSFRTVPIIQKPGSGNGIFIKAILAGFCIFYLSSSVLAQDSLLRPKIGLVLSGGASRGIAHVGVLKVMEEAGLRPDFISGASMGSIIGGFYALGYTADTLKQLLKSMDWDLIMSNKIPQNKIIFPEKRHFDNSIMSLPASLRKVKLPSGLISGQQVENALSFYAWPAADINDFSKLPIPFVCVGADLLTIRKVDLKTGYLPDAMRASSAIPTVFAPIKIDTALLTDGGLISNFPASEVKDMGADFIIGSYVGFQPYDEDELKSVPGIIKQIGFSRSIEDLEKQKKLVDILILPVLKNISSLDFTPVDTIVERGYKAALPYREYFRKLADSLDNYGKQEPLVNILDKKYYSFDRVEINGNSIISDSQILGVLDVEPGEQVGRNKLYDKIELLYGRAWFEKVKYRIEPRNDSLILVIECIEKPKTMFYGSVHYDNALGSGIVFSVSAKNLLSPKSEINMDSYLARFYRARCNFLQYIDKNQKLGLSLDFYADNTLIPKLSLRGETGDVKSLEFSSGLSVSRTIGLNQMMNISVSYKNLFLMPQYVSEINLNHFSYNYLTSTFNYRVKSLDNRHFPDKGMIFSISAGASDLISGSIKKGSARTVYDKDNPGDFAFNRFYTLRGNYRQYLTSFDKLTFSVSGDVLYITDCDSITSQNNFFLLGGIASLNDRSIPMLGFHPNEIPVKKMAGIGMEFDWEIFKDFHLNLAGNIFAAQEADREKGYSILAGYGLGAGYMSIIGPLKAGIMQGFYEREKYFKNIKGYISVGFQF